MPTILSRSGVSLADLYDIRGSIIGIEELVTHDVSLIHEMGATIMSERFVSTIRRMNTGALAQSVAFDIVVTDLPADIFRVLGVSVLAEAPANQVTDCNVSLRDPTNGRELPIFVWNTAQDTQPGIRIVENNAAVASLILLRPAIMPGNSPSIMTGINQRVRTPELTFRGTTAAFGAGTVEVTALVYIGFANIGVSSGVSNFGLPMPGW